MRFRLSRANQACCAYSACQVPLYRSSDFIGVICDVSYCIQLVTSLLPVIVKQPQVFDGGSIESQTADGLSVVIVQQNATVALRVTHGDPRGVAGNPYSPQAVVFLTSIIDVIVGY